jgi:hypothetical protein
MSDMIQRTLLSSLFPIVIKVILLHLRTVFRLGDFEGLRDKITFWGIITKSSTSILSFLYENCERPQKKSLHFTFYRSTLDPPNKFNSQSLFIESATYQEILLSESPVWRQHSLIPKTIPISWWSKGRIFKKFLHWVFLFIVQAAMTKICHCSEFESFKSWHPPKNFTCDTIVHPLNFWFLTEKVIPFHILSLNPWSTKQIQFAVTFYWVANISRKPSQWISSVATTLFNSQNPEQWSKGIILKKFPHSLLWVSVINIGSERSVSTR